MTNKEFMQSVNVELARIMGVDLDYCAPEARPRVMSRQIKALVIVINDRLNKLENAVQDQG